MIIINHFAIEIHKVWMKNGSSNFAGLNTNHHGCCSSVWGLLMLTVTFHQIKSALFVRRHITVKSSQGTFTCRAGADRGLTNCSQPGAGAEATVTPNHPHFIPGACALHLRSSPAADRTDWRVPSPSQLQRYEALRSKYAGLLFFCQISEQNSEIRHRTDRAGQEGEHRNNINHTVYFQN